MPSGYEKSRDYGGPPPTLWGTVLGVLIFLAVVALLFWRAS